ncbi:DUF1501 domain-containing protein [Erythrobacter sp. Alg231-14]|uniref:DUF1501 domain-containing protein n=1 Tax=Erythrobacter sp. Alg231-14 TaxID=1922225 RepID=UPI00307B1B75
MTQEKTAHGQMALNRRSLLTKGLGGSIILGTAGMALPRMAFAQGVGHNNLLFVLLRGAADGMAMVAPVDDPGFAALRGSAMDDYDGARRTGGLFAIHPALDQVGAAFDAGEAVFAHAAATSYRERSHFDGQNLLETGAAQPYAVRDGWMNRLIAMMAEDAGAPPPSALAIAPTMPLALRGDAPASSYAPSSLPQASDAFMDRVGLLYREDPQLGGLWSRALETQAMAGDDGLRNLRDAQAAGELAASLMRDTDGARIAMMELGGWDTHANQSGAFRRVVSQLDALLGSYRTGMGSAWDNTLVVVATEFGRTARYNGTNGTDHGTASATLLMGGTVRGGRVIADWPGLRENDLYENRDLRPTLALESVIAGSVAEHLRMDPARTMARLFPGRTDTALGGIIKA